jgi:hypothetical protein
MTDDERFEQWVQLGNDLARSPTLNEGKRRVVEQMMRLIAIASGAAARLGAQLGQTNTELPVEPRYEHDCSKCVFLGQHYDDKEVQNYDLYFCPQHGLGMPTVLARHGSSGPDYASGLGGADVVPPLREAKRRAINKGLLRE